MRTLTVGDGDFSFSAGLLGRGLELTATAYDTEVSAVAKYGQEAARHLEALRAGGAAVLFGVDATALPERFAAGEQFDLIVFNFPHTGQKGSKALASNRSLVRGFLSSCQGVLAAGGAVEVSLKTTARYAVWGLEQLAEGAGLHLHAVRRFKCQHTHRRTVKDSRSEKVQLDHAATWRFRREVRPGLARGVRAGQAPERACELPAWYKEEREESCLVCGVCDMVFTTEIDLRKHMAGGAHSKRVRAIKKRNRQQERERLRRDKKAKRADGADAEAPGQQFCSACKVMCNSAKSWEMHVQGARHRAAVGD